MISFWQLPGPLRFVESVVEDLRSGKNVVVCAPSNLPETAEKLERAIHRALDHDFTWTPLDVASDCDKLPIDQLFETFLPLAAPSQIRNTLSLVQEDTFAGRLVHLRGLFSGNWPAWRDFLTQYEPACRTRSVIERTVLLAIIDATCIGTPEDACLTAYRTEGMVDSLDLLLYSSSAFTDARLSNWQKRLAVSIAARLALWDPEVCDRLRRCALESILQPQELLSEMGVQRGWCVTDGANPARLREKCILQNFEGVPQFHSAFLAIAGDKQELKRRLWSAEVEALFPLIELHRHRLIDQLGSHLAVPHTTPFGVINDVRDLELTHIADQLYSSRIPEHHQVRAFAQWLKRLRDRLAHSDPIPVNLLLHTQFSTLLDGI